ncbi:putative reverse transcriptase domain-containing protein, partial [Tanacetum coccineum]
GKKVKFAASTLEGPALTLWKTKVETMGLETVNQMPWTEMKQLMTAERFNELALMCPRMVKPERVKVDAYIRGLTDNIKGEVTSSKPVDLSEAIRMAHNQKQGNVRAMVTAPTDGKLPLCERCFTRHVGQCTIKCHKCGKFRHKARYCKGKSVATGANAQPVWTFRGRAYAIKDAEPKEFCDTRFSSLLDINPIKIEDTYEVELADGRIIELGTFDVIIGMDWLVKHDAIIVCGEKFVLIPYRNKTLIVEGDKGVSRLKVISCIKARKYVERGCHLFLAHVMENK